MTIVALMPKEPVETDEFTLMQKLEITFAQAVILKRMLDSGSVGLNMYPPMRALRQHIYKLRLRLEGRGMFIINAGPGRYGLTKDSRERLDHILHCGQ